MTPEAKVFRKAARLVFRNATSTVFRSNNALFEASKDHKIAGECEWFLLGLYPEIHLTTFKNQEHRVMALLLAAEIAESGGL